MQGSRSVDLVKMRLGACRTCVGVGDVQMVRRLRLRDAFCTSVKDACARLSVRLSFASMGVAFTRTLRRDLSVLERGVRKMLL